MTAQGKVEGTVLDGSTNKYAVFLKAMDVEGVGVGRGDGLRCFLQAREAVACEGVVAPQPRDE